MEINRVNHAIKKLVQNTTTRAFLTTGGTWTTDANNATVFPSTEAARKAVLERRITDVELYYQYGEETSTYDFTITL